MDAIELTQLFVEAAETRKRLAEVESAITAAVLEMGETQKIAGVKATYYKPGFTTPNYEAAARANLPDYYDLEPYTTVRTSVKWKDVCASATRKPQTCPRGNQILRINQ